MKLLLWTILCASALTVAHGGDNDPDFYDDEHDVSGLIDED